MCNADRKPYYFDGQGIALPIEPYENLVGVSMYVTRSVGHLGRMIRWKHLFLPLTEIDAKVRSR